MHTEAKLSFILFRKSIVLVLLSFMSCLVRHKYISILLPLFHKMSIIREPQIIRTPCR